METKNLEYVGGITTQNGYHRKSVHEETGIEREVFTKRKNGRPVDGTQEVCWYHPKDEKTHKTFQAALESAKELGLVTD